MWRTILIIAWRNVWRNGRRSWVLIGAVATGVFTFVGSTAFMDGFGYHMITAATRLQGGHVQISRAGYHDNPTLESVLPEDFRMELPGRSAPQLVGSGLANSSERASGVVIRGVDPVREPDVTSIASHIVEGAYLEEGAAPGTVVIGWKLAERLRLRLGERIVLMLNDRNNEVSAGAFRVGGLFRTSSTAFDESQVYMNIDEARALFGYDRASSLIAIRLDRERDVPAVAAILADQLEGSGLEVLTWQDRNPMAEMSMEAYDYSVILMAIILFMAVGFTLINSFLMVIFERIREIGVLLAAGTRPGIIRRMLMAEALMVAGLGTGAGIVVSVLFLGYWFAKGLDLSGFSEGLGQVGIPDVVYPVLDAGHMAMGFAIILAMVILAVLWPAFKASRFEPVEAMNHV